MNVQRLYVGLDAASRHCEFVALDKEGVVFKAERFDTSEQNLIRLFSAFPGDVAVHLESSELAAWLTRVLRPIVEEVRVSHPKTNAWIAKDPRKNDRVDAYKLADLLRMGRIHDVYYPAEEDRLEFKRIVQHYDLLTEHEIRLKNQIKARLRVQGIICTGPAIYRPLKREEILDRVRSSVVRESIEDLCEFLDHTVEMWMKAKALMVRVSRRYPEIACFKKVPGIGDVGACRFSGYVQTPFRFSAKRKLWRYSQLGVAKPTSDGKPLGYERLDRNGNPNLKRMSYHAFLGAMRTKEPNRFQRAYNASLARTHNKKHARLNTQRLILSVLLAMWKGGAEYQDDKG